MGESISVLSWLSGRVSICSQLAVWESQYMLAVGCMGESVGALSLLYMGGQ